MNFNSNAFKSIEYNFRTVNMKYERHELSINHQFMSLSRDKNDWMICPILPRNKVGFFCEIN